MVPAQSVCIGRRSGRGGGATRLVSGGEGLDEILEAGDLRSKLLNLGRQLRCLAQLVQPLRRSYQPAQSNVEEKVL